MQILYTCDGEGTGIMDLDQLIANFTDNDGWFARHNAEDMRDELQSRGWYEGLHDNGHYLVLNLAKLGLSPVHGGLDERTRKAIADDAKAHPDEYALAKRLGL